MVAGALVATTAETGDSEGRAVEQAKLDHIPASAAGAVVERLRLRMGLTVALEAGALSLGAVD